MVTYDKWRLAMIGEFAIKHVEFTVKQIEKIREKSFHIGTRHRQLIRPDLFRNAIVMTDNVSNCLAGVGLVPKGLFVFHDPPFRVLNHELPIAKSMRSIGIIGGSLTHWEATQESYNRSGIVFEYIKKPKGEERNTDLSFAFAINIPNLSIEYGYYQNPKGYSNDGWLFE